jgi:hypothetical protein
MSVRRTSPLPLTRRRWTALLGIAPFAVQLTRAQTTAKTPPQGAPAPAPVSATPEAKLQKAYADVHDTSVKLSQIVVPMNVEPAFTFKA